MFLCTWDKDYKASEEISWWSATNGGMFAKSELAALIEKVEA